MVESVTTDCVSSASTNGLLELSCSVRVSVTDLTNGVDNVNSVMVK